MATLAVMGVIVVNELFKMTFGVLVEFEGHETLTRKILAHTTKLFGSMFMNTGMLVVLISGNMNFLTGGREGFMTRTLEMTNIMSGSNEDFTPAWYLRVECVHSLTSSTCLPHSTCTSITSRSLSSRGIWCLTFPSVRYTTVGTSICMTVFVSVVNFNIKTIQSFVKLELSRCLDRRCSFDMKVTKKKLQVRRFVFCVGHQRPVLPAASRWPRCTLRTSTQGQS